MPSFTLESRTFGSESFRCSDVERSSYVFDEYGAQPCDGGGYRGSTLTATPETLEAVVRRWHRQRMTARREAGLYPGAEAELANAYAAMEAEKFKTTVEAVAKALAPYGYSNADEAHDAGDWNALAVAFEAANDPARDAAA